MLDPWLKWHYASLIGNNMCKLKVKIPVYFVTNMFSFMLNIVSTKPKQKYENGKIDFDSFYLQEIKRVGQSFYILTIFIL